MNILYPGKYHLDFSKNAEEDLKLSIQFGYRKYPEL